MSKKTLKFNNVEVNKKEFHKSKQPIDLKLVNVNQILIPNKSMHSDDGLAFTKKILLDCYVLSYLK